LWGHEEMFRVLNIKLIESAVAGEAMRHVHDVLSLFDGCSHMSRAGLSLHFTMLALGKETESEARAAVLLVSCTISSTS